MLMSEKDGDESRGCVLYMIHYSGPAFYLKTHRSRCQLVSYRGRASNHGPIQILYYTVHRVGASLMDPIRDNAASCCWRRNAAVPADRSRAWRRGHG